MIFSAKPCMVEIFGSVLSSKSELLEIEGVGKKRAEILLKHFGSMKKIKTANIDELLAVKGMTKTAAENIYKTYH